jgi:hypothetical protein
MLGLGTLRKDAPLRWAAVIAIRLVLVYVAILILYDIALTPGIGMCRTTRARAEATEIGKAVGIHLTLTGRMPASLDDLRRPLARNGGDSVIEIGNDPWGRPYRFTVDGPRAVTVSCLGADGEPGGRGEDEDIVVHWPTPVRQAPR